MFVLTFNTSYQDEYIIKYFTLTVIIKIDDLLGTKTQIVRLSHNPVLSTNIEVILITFRSRRRIKKSPIKTPNDLRPREYGTLEYRSTIYT